MAFSINTINNLLPNKYNKNKMFLLFLFALVSIWLHIIIFVFWQLAMGSESNIFSKEFKEIERPMFEITLEMPLIKDEIDLNIEKELVAEKELVVEDKVLNEKQNETNLSLSDTILPTDNNTPEKINENQEEVPVHYNNALAPITLQSDAPKFKSYFSKVRTAVAKNWILPPEKFEKPGQLVAILTINKMGGLVRIVVVESSGSTSLDHAGLEALRSAAPFDAFPESLHEFSQLDITMYFDYRAQYIKSLSTENNNLN